MRVKQLLALLFFFASPALVIARSGSPEFENVAENADGPFGWQCWNVGTTDPCQRDILAVEAISPDDVWAVGTGAPMHWDGHQWQRFPTGHYAFSLGVSAVATDDVWATAIDYSYDKSYFLHWDGSQWYEEDLAGDSFVVKIDMISADDGWATGSDILHWDGTSWNKVDDRSATAVDMIGPDDGWLATREYVDDDYRVQLLHWNGSVFEEYVSPDPDNNELWDIQMVASDDVWAVGEGGTALRWNGTSWTAVPFPTNDEYLLAVAMATGDDGWAFSEGWTYRWNGMAWTTYGRGGANAADMVSSSEGFLASDDGMISRWDGISWEREGSPTTPLSAVYYDIEIVNERQGWAVGQTHERFQTIIRWDGRQWSTSFFEVGNALTSVDFLSENDGWTVGHAGYTRHWDGVSWQLVNTPTYEGFLEGVSMVAPNDVWAVGQRWDTDDPLSWHWTGSGWEDVPVPLSGLSLLDVEMLTATNGWAVGQEGTIVHWNGSEWQSVNSGTIDDLKAVDMLAADDGWAAGSNALLRWNGSNWLVVTIPGEIERIGDIAMLAPDDGWLLASTVDGRPVAFHWNGSGWHANPLPAGASSLAAVSPLEAWAVGGGPILHYLAFVPEEFLFLPLIRN